jgi:hypothetical protein
MAMRGCLFFDLPQFYHALSPAAPAREALISHGPTSGVH